MPLENFNLIPDLDVTSPAAGENISFGDDHIRGLKVTLKNQFPNITSAITATSAQLNDVIQLRTDVSALQTSNSGKLTLTGGTLTGPLVGVSFSAPVMNAGNYRLNGTPLLQRGMVIMWWGASNQVPAGWQICDGTNGTPDLRDRFIVGAGTSYGVGTAGGAAIQSFATSPAGGHSHGGQTQPGGAHNHSGQTGGTSLTVDQLPPHDHYIGTVGFNGLVEDGIGTPDGPRSWNDGNGPKMTTSPTGSANAHAHPIVAEGDHTHPLAFEPNHQHAVNFDNRPPFVALFFLMFMVAQA
ncbi:hypothetical protein [Roseomonas chloroacetimidivorans]|uniref:hypothetical protein n=1 Tax=Roseomonas chloroacetimidivorans TaxID=1766656 RepID=UPI003C73BACE